jgi:hypothetical protein
MVSIEQNVMSSVFMLGHLHQVRMGGQCHFPKVFFRQPGFSLAHGEYSIHNSIGIEITVEFCTCPENLARFFRLMVKIANSLQPLAS